MRTILLVLYAVIIQQIGIRRKHLRQLNGPRLGVGLQIVHRDLNFKLPEVNPANALRDLRGFCQRTAAGIQPYPVAEAAGF